jgi:ribonuclease HI
MSATAAAIADGTVVAYADGACSGNPGPAGLGVVLLDGPQRVEISEYLGEGTNNIAELTAVLRALEEIKDPSRKLIIRTDSQYTIGILQKGWKAKANVELIEKLREVLRRRPARIEYVPGHAGVALNERADALAREAVAGRKSRRAVIEKTPALPGGGAEPSG